MVHAALVWHTAGMIPNRILERERNGEKALGLGLKEPSSLLVELAGRMGLDFVEFDGQHAPVTPAEIGHLCRIADALGITVAMRIPDGRESTILSYLDRGVAQITVPNLLTREEAQALVKYAFYAPLGLRSATSVAIMHGQLDGDHVRLFQEVNANTVIVPQLESIVALENLDEILAVDGIDYFGGGAEDMAQSLGLPGQPRHPRVTEAYAEITRRLHAAGKRMAGEVMESVNSFDLTKDAIAGLLGKHGRKSKLGW